MIVSEISLSVAKKYIRVDHDEDNELIQMFLDSSIAYVKSYTGLDIEKMDMIKELVPPVLIICADMYDNRSVTDSGQKVSKDINPVLDSILGMHSINLL